MLGYHIAIAALASVIDKTNQKKLTRSLMIGKFKSFVKIQKMSLDKKTFEHIYMILNYEENITNKN